jgi:hypothetical protein
VTDALLECRPYHEENDMTISRLGLVAVVLAFPVMGALAGSGCGTSPMSSAGDKPGGNDARGGNVGSGGRSADPGNSSGSGGSSSGSGGNSSSGGNSISGGSSSSGGSSGSGGTAPDPDVTPDAAAPSDSGAPADEGGTTTPPGPILSGLEQRLVTRAVGLAYYHLCLLLPSHELRCSGDVAVPDEPRLHPPAGLKGEQIAAAHNGFCVLRAGATQALPEPAPGEPPFLALNVTAKKLTCWGHKDTFFPPAGLDMDPIQYGIGYDHGCALNRDHSVVCWGQPGTNFKQPDGLKAKALTVAAFFNCAITEDDGVVCWGINPPMPPPGLKAKIVAAVFHGNDKLPAAPQGNSHACAIKLDDTVTCWGTEVEGNLTPPADLTAAKDIAVSTWDSCALRPNGEPVCWGNKVYDDKDPLRYHPMPAGLHLKGLRASMATYCGIKMEDDTVVCWGDEQHDHITFPPGGIKVFSP